MCALPSVFLIDALVKPMWCSQNPPNQGAFLGMNFHTMPSWTSVVLMSSELSKSVSSYAADRYVVALSDIITCGKELRAVKQRNECTKVPVERFVTTSRCSALDVAQVNKQMYTLPSSLLLCFT